ncbi:Fatty acid hydroxylase domain-containing protein 2 [Araneus ventricosus]|uniref:Fatty acid hydroxylase domain-containing protein 2 n=1 Tax=Araneus ventricosus TaxID=182803 RepID=A0A4Y2Q070_ARAVE|nr:Fatty acid hydroxylase domain-containing protein 2 [Araneus ventricosus]
MRQFQSFSDKSGDILQNYWNVIYEFFGSDPLTLWVWGTFLMATVLHWTVGLCYTVIDLTGKPAFILKYKIQDASTHPVSLTDVLKVVKQVLINQMISFLLLFVGYYIMLLRGYDSGKTLPTLRRTLFELTVCVLTNEIWFYCSHRLLHHPSFYKHIHKVHHEWIAPISISALYCHPVEYVFCILVSAFIGPLLLGSHTATFWLWISLVMISTLIAHSGYSYPFPASPTAHDIHHSKFNANFGFWGIMDRIVGTDYKSKSKMAD